jgi:hypothetical protein
VLVTLGIIALQLVLDFTPRLREKNQSSVHRDPIRWKRRNDIDKNQAGYWIKNANLKSSTSSRELVIMIWLFAMLASIYLFGFLIAMPLFVFVSLLFMMRERWIITAAVTLSVALILYCILFLLVQNHSIGGILWRFLR